MNKAALAILLCACGSAPEMEPDEPMPQTPVPNHQIQVADESTGLPTAGAIVVVHHADGTIRSTTTTDPGGLANVFVEAGDGITVGRATSSGLSTILSVSPGGRSHFQTYGGSNAQAGTLMVNVPPCAQGLFVTAGPDSYVATTGALVVSPESVGRSGRLTVFAACLSSGYSIVHDVEVPAPGAGGSLDLPAWQSTFRTIGLDISGNQSYAEGVSAASLRYAAIVDGVLLETSAYAIPSGQATLTVDRLPAIDVEGFAEIASVSYSPRRGTSELRRFRPAGATTGSLDLGAVLPPRWVTSKTADPAGRHQVSLEPSTGALGADALRVQMGSWLLVMPPDRADFRLPELPASLRTQAPASVDDVFTLLIDVSDLSGYDEFLGAGVTWDRFTSAPPTAARSFRFGNAFNQ